MHRPTVVSTTVDPMESPARAESLMWPTMAVSIMTKSGEAISWPKVGMASPAMVR